MGRWLAIIFLFLVAVGALVASGTLFTVHQTKQALVLQFGDIKRVIREPGLNMKVPFVQNVIMFDNRILELDIPPEEVLASDQKRLVVDAFARFRIADPLKFYQSVNNETAARARMQTILRASTREVLAEQEFITLLSGERSALMRRIRDDVNARAEPFGIDVVDVRIRRTDLPTANSRAVYDRMNTERQREAAEARARGKEEAQRITSKADRDVSVILATAKRDAEIVRGEGDAQRNKVFAQAFGQDPEFFAFYRAMLAYEQALKSGDTTMVLSPDSEFFRFFGNLDGNSKR